MFDQTKNFLIILYVLGSDFYHSLCSCLVLTVFFFVFSMFCVEKQVSKFLATHLATHSRVASFGDLLVSSEFWLLVLATHSRVASSSRGFHDSLATRLSTRPIAKFPETAF